MTSQTLRIRIPRTPSVPTDTAVLEAPPPEASEEAPEAARHVHHRDAAAP